MSSTWWQAVYTSADSDDGTPGGWGIKRVRPAAAGTVAERMLAGVDTRLESAVELGNFPNADLLTRRTRQLTARLEGDRRVLTHSVPAGLDGTGRPGNVFVHAAMAQEPLDVTAAQYWRSPSWLVPFGPQGVATAELPAAIEVGTTITRASVAAFLSQPGRLGVLAVLLEVLDDRAGPERRSVALVVDDDNEAALWIGAVGFLRDPREDVRLTWSTWCRGDTLQVVKGLGVRLMAVPRPDLDKLRAWAASNNDVRVVDPARPPLRTANEWTDDRGTPVQAAWASELVDLLDRATVEFGAGLLADILDDIAEVAATSSDDYEDPLWSLAVALLADPDITVERRGVHTEGLLVSGPRELRPEVSALALDSWWRADEASVVTSVAQMSPGLGDVVWERRAALLLAGVLSWNDAIDTGRALSASAHARLAPVVARASERLAALLDLGTKADEAAQMLRVFQGYGLRLPAALDDALARLVAGKEEHERSRLLALASPGRAIDRTDRLTGVGVQTPSVSMAKSVRPRTPAPRDLPPHGPAVVPPVARPEPAVVPPAASRVPDQPKVAPAQPQPDKTELIEAFVLELRTALGRRYPDKYALSEETFAQLERELRQALPEHVAAVLAASLDEADLEKFIRTSMEVAGRVESGRSPFHVRSGVRPTRALIYLVAVELLALVEIDGRADERWQRVARSKDELTHQAMTQAHNLVVKKRGVQ